MTYFRASADAFVIAGGLAVANLSLDGLVRMSLCELSRVLGSVSGEGTVISVDIASVILRVAIGVTMIAHGYNHAFGGGKLAGTAR
jgi:hypothetical protein